MSWPRRLVGLLAAAVVLVAVVALERARQVDARRITVETTPVTVWNGDADAPLVVVAHGYAGSRQMMQSLSLTLSRSGFRVAAFDFHGHGRNPEPIRGDLAYLTGATADLVAQTQAVTEALRGDGPVALLGHSMATDVVIRAAGEMPDVAAVVAISMYSEATTATFPQDLLIVSGATEGRLREVALDRLRQVDPNAEEGQTATDGPVRRRAIAAPRVGHVGVLYSSTTLRDVRDWIADATGRPAAGGLVVTGPWILALLAGLVALAWPLTARSTGPAKPPGAWGPRATGLAVGLPILPAFAAATLMPDAVLGLRAFGGVAAGLGVWGLVQGAVLWRAGWRPGRISPAGLALFLGWGLVFALALDRYAAAFLPVGPRIGLTLVLLPATLVFCLADAGLTSGLRWALRPLVRAVPLAILLGAMFAAPDLGVAFTVVPVAALFWLVYGSVGRWTANRSGPATAGLGLGLVLAWAIAASTPLVAA